MTIKFVGIGGMGLMLSPSAKHLKPGGPARFLRIHDRGTAHHRCVRPCPVGEQLHSLVGHVLIDTSASQ